MKRTTLLSIMFLATTLVFGQTQKLSLIEHFTQASCGFCPPGNIHIDEIVETNSENVIVMRYQVWWPGYDPMYFHNTADVDNRVGYYSVSGVPHSVYEGNVYSGNNYYAITDELVTSRTTSDASFNIEVDHTISPNNDSIYITISYSATEAVSGNLKAHVAVVERHIPFDEAPGSNGEKDFYNVMKKMFPDANGTDLPESMADSDSETLTFSWKLENVYNVNELAVIAFVQNGDTKEIMQAALSDKKPAYFEYDKDISVLSASNLPPSVCGDEGTLAPIISFKNYGAVSSTSIDFKYKINNGPESTYTWTGGIRHTETRIAELDEISFTPAESNFLYIYATSINGVEDENHANDTLVVEIPNSIVVNKMVTLELQTDDSPHQIFWKFYHYDDLTTPIARNNPYSGSDVNTLITETFEMTQDGCYQFVIQDLNGLDEGAYYKLYDSNGQQIFEGGDFVGKEIIPFKVSLDLSSELINAQNENITLYPNPANNTLFINTNMEFEISNISVYNTIGQEVLVSEKNNLNKVSLDVSSLNKGIYIIQFTTSNLRQFTKKFVINR
jgi:Outer membrane protein Omp28/Secretion system C-terminal sorting domain